MEQITAAQIIYVKPRGSEMVQGEIKGAFEYNGGHGATTFFVSAVVAEEVLQDPQLAELAAVDTIKFQQQPEGGWQVVFSDEEMTGRVAIATTEEEMEKLCQRDHIQLVHV